MVSENRQISPNARTLYELQERFHKVSFVEAATNLQFDIHKRTVEALKVGENLREKVHDHETLSQYQKYVRDHFLMCQGGLPETEAPLNGRVLSTQEYENFVLEKVIYESRPQVYVTCNLYRPLVQNQSCPAVLLLVGHANEGKAYPEYQQVAQMLVYAGFVVLVMDPVGEGERFEHYETELDYQPIQGCSGEHDLLDWKCKLLGLSLSRYFIHDGLRGLEYLAARPEVDASRIAVTGQSGGGTQTSMLMAVAADKIAAAAPCSYTTDELAMVECGKDMDNEMMWPGILSAGLDFVDIISVFAPKPLLFLTNRYDFFPREGTDRTLEKARRLWRQAGSPHVPEIARSYTQHSYSTTLAQTVTLFFSRHLQGYEPDLSGFRFHPFPQEELRCTSNGAVIRDFPQVRTIQMELREEYNQIISTRSSQPWEKTKADILNYLHSMVFGHRTKLPLNVRVCDEGGCCQYIYRRLLWRAQENYWGTGILLRDMRYEGLPLPTVVACWPNGTRALAEHSLWIHRQCVGKKQVLIIDLTASGSLEPNSLSNTRINTGWGTLFICNGFLIKLGDSIAASRIYQTISSLGVVKDLPLKDSGEISYYGEGEFARYAKIAGLLAGVPVESHGLYQDYDEIVREKYHDQTHTHDWLLPGILKHLDMKDIDRYLKEEDLML